MTQICKFTNAINWHNTNWHNTNWQIVQIGKEQPEQPDYVSNGLPVFVPIGAVKTWQKQFYNVGPRSCECKWKRGKETVTCVNTGFNYIPRPIDAGTQVRTNFSENEVFLLNVAEVVSVVSVVEGNRIRDYFFAFEVQLR